MDTIAVLEQPEHISRSKRLKAAIHAAHDRLDHRLMAGQPFSSRARYGLFLRVQSEFHRDIDALYDAPALDALLPDLKGRRRLGLVRQDLSDLEIVSMQDGTEPAFAEGAAIDVPAALGWLYVAEGSNLGAAFLLKEATKLGLSESFGARHLAGAPEGRGLHWRTFTGALDAIELSQAEEDRVIAGANAAFRRVASLVENFFGSGEE